jgi:NAD-dependent DNA ligase
MHKDHRSYFNFTGRARIEKAVNSLAGFIEGISIDGVINASELEILRFWLEEHSEDRNRHPFSELVPVVQSAIADGVLNDEERQDILWLCERIQSADFYDAATAGIQRLHAIMGGIAADGMITENELRGLSEWLGDHDHLKSCWPYDEVDSLVTAVLADGRIDEQEHKLLQNFFAEFIAILDNRTIASPKIIEGTTIVGLCAVCPEIDFHGSKFCFTGSSSKYTRAEFTNLVRRLGGEAVGSVSATLNYLVIGAEGNPCWAYACYGRKVEKAVTLRKQGAQILLVHENDFHDAVADSA